MPLFDLPFLPDPDYCDLIAARAASVQALHFGLFHPRIADGRPKETPRNIASIIQGLERFPDQKKYALLNGRFQAPNDYFDPTFTEETLGLLARLLDAGVVHGVVYADQYLVQALSDAGPDICAQLEAVPSINCRLDSLPKVRAWIGHIGRTAFRPPSKLVLDRSLNRDVGGLARLSGRIRAAFPGTRVEILANEGCLPFCPYKDAHDAHIALANSGGPEISYRANSRLGCGRAFLERPELILASPFLRPEDVSWVDGLVDGIKLCGRSRGPAALGKLVTAYLDGSYQGNLLELMDAMEHLADFMELPNQDLPEDFYVTVSRCSGDCHQCSYCRDIAGRVIRRRSLPLKRMWAV